MTTPRVTVIVPMRNEETGIIACLSSILANTVDGDLELLVLDGESDDNSGQLVSSLALKDPRVRLIANPARLQADAFNIGLAEAKGEFIVRMDAHTLYEPDYVAECIRLLEEMGADNVGGVQTAAGTSRVSKAIAVAVASKFAAGDAKYRNSLEPAWVDTVYLGAWRTQRLRDLGGMIPGYAVNEDYEMNIRLRQAGGKIFLSPTIKSTYFVRGSLTKLARQYFRYGFWKVRTLILHPGSLRWRQLVAPAFALTMVATPILVWWLGAFGLVPLGTYVLANLAASVMVAVKRGWVHLPLLPVIFFLIHAAWGFGFIAGWGHWPTRADAQ